MKIIGASWTPAMNMLEIECDLCGNKFPHRADRQYIKCESCSNADNLHVMRRRELTDAHTQKSTHSGGASINSNSSNMVGKSRTNKDIP